MANLDLLDLLPEPVAAALAEGLQKFDGKQEQFLLVYDFGGGTLDVTILKIANNTFETMCIAGNDYLGG